MFRSIVSARDAGVVPRTLEVDRLGVAGINRDATGQVPEKTTSAALPTGEVAVPNSADIDKYQDRLLKLIPAEVIALYLTLAALAKSALTGQGATPWIVFGLCLVAVPVYLNRVSHVQKWMQLLVSTVAFVVWVFAIGGPFAGMKWYDPAWGGMAVASYTFLVPLLPI